MKTVADSTEGRAGNRPFPTHISTASLRLAAASASCRTPGQADVVTTMIGTLVLRKGGGTVRGPLDSDQHQDAAKAPFANFRSQPSLVAGGQTFNDCFWPVGAGQVRPAMAVGVDDGAWADSSGSRFRATQKSAHAPRLGRPSRREQVQGATRATRRSKRRA